MESLKYFFLVFLTSYYSFFHYHLLSYILIILSLYYSNSFLATLYVTFLLIDLSVTFCQVPFLSDASFILLFSSFINNNHNKLQNLKE